MFSDINAESTRRLTEAKSLVLLIKNEDLMRSLNLDSKVHKGAFFVLLYGALEYTITAVVQRCISILNAYSGGYPFSISGDIRSVPS
jgi:hypothetical protein